MIMGFFQKDEPDVDKTSNLKPVSEKTQIIPSAAAIPQLTKNELDGQNITLLIIVIVLIIILIKK